MRKVRGYLHKSRVMQLRRITYLLGVGLLAAQLSACGESSAKSIERIATKKRIEARMQESTPSDETQEKVVDEAVEVPAPTEGKLENLEEAPKGSVTIYTAFSEEEAAYYFGKFEEETGIRVKYIRFSAGDMIRAVQEQREEPLASAMMGGSSDNYIYAANEGLLEPYQSQQLMYTPKEFLDPKKVWNPIYAGCICFACNRTWFNENNMDFPQSWEDLLDTRLNGQIIGAHPASSGTGYTVLATLVQLKGEKTAFTYLEQLKKNGIQLIKEGPSVMDALISEDAAVGLVFSHDALRKSTDEQPIVLTFPQNGTGYEVGAAALLKNGPEQERECAEYLIDWMCSTNGQNLYAENSSYRLPSNTAAKVAYGLVTLDSVKTINYDANWAAQERNSLVERFEKEIATLPVE